MASADLANLAAAVTAGYQETVSVGSDGRYTVLLGKPITGDPDGGSGHSARAWGVGLSQSAAESQALASLNNKRGHRYGFDTGATSMGGRNATAHTRDVT